MNASQSNGCKWRVISASSYRCQHHPVSSETSKTITNDEIWREKWCAFVSNFTIFFSINYRILGRFFDDISASFCKVKQLSFSPFRGFSGSLVWQVIERCWLLCCFCCSFVRNGWLNAKSSCFSIENSQRFGICVRFIYSFCSFHSVIFALWFHKSSNTKQGGWFFNPFVSWCTLSFMFFLTLLNPRIINPLVFMTFQEGCEVLWLLNIRMISNKTLN